jgi:pyruvate dehydrogenase E2 component (dihydrolipoamide acetyltransferase)
MNVPGRWLKRVSTWRKLSLNTWHTPDNATIYGTLDIDVGPVQAYLKKKSEESGVKVSLTHAVTRGLALVLRRYPEANVLVRRRKLWLRRDVDIFHQVAMPVEGESNKADLSGATIRQADTKPITEIARELKERAEAVRAKKDGEMAKTRSLMGRLPNFLLRWILRVIDWFSYTLNLRLPTVPRDPFGGAMVTAVGMFGIKTALAPLVTFSRVPILLLVGQVEDRAVVREGQIVVRPMCTITATLDHRIIDGYLGGILSKEMVGYLEHPERLDEDPPRGDAGP